MEEIKPKIEQNDPKQKRSFLDNVWSGAKNAIAHTKDPNDKRSASSRFLDSTLKLSIIGIVLFAMTMSVVILGPFGWILAAAIGGSAIGKYIYDKKQNEQKITNMMEQKKVENIKSKEQETTKENEMQNQENINQNDKSQDIDNNNITSNQSQFSPQYNPYSQQYNPQFQPFNQQNQYGNQNIYNPYSQQYNPQFQPFNQQNQYGNQNNQNIYNPYPQQFQKQVY